jgi:hypothetical protein
MSLIIFATPPTAPAPYNLAYNLQQIKCPRWLPGSDELVPQGVVLPQNLQLQNKVRCFCEVVKREEQRCLRRQVPGTICKERTSDWVRDNLALLGGDNQGHQISPVPMRDRAISVQP